jgi:hypothetical protein
LLQLDTLCRLIVDRQWSVGELTSAVLRFSHSAMQLSEDPGNPPPDPSRRTLFNELIAGVEQTQQQFESEL